MKVKTLQSKEAIEKLVTAEELAEAAGLTVSYIKKAVRLYGLPHYKVSGLRFRLSEVEAWIKGRRKVAV